MRNDVSRKYDGENFRAEKMVAMLYLAAFCSIVGFGVQTQLSGKSPEVAYRTSTNVAQN